MEIEICCKKIGGKWFADDADSEYCWRDMNEDVEEKLF